MRGHICQLLFHRELSDCWSRDAPGSFSEVGRLCIVIRDLVDTIHESLGDIITKHVFILMHFQVDQIGLFAKKLYDVFVPVLGLSSCLLILLMSIFILGLAIELPRNAKRLVLSPEAGRFGLHFLRHLFLVLQAVIKIKLVCNLHECFGRRALAPLGQLGQVVAARLPFQRWVILLQIRRHPLFVSILEYLLLDYF